MAEALTPVSSAVAAAASGAVGWLPPAATAWLPGWWVWPPWHALPGEVLKWLSIGWLLYLVALTVWIVLQRRSPVSTLAWVMSLAALPFVGFFVYYLFGPVKVQRRVMRRERSRRRFGANSKALDSDEDPMRLELPALPTERAKRLQRLGEALTALPLSSCTDVRFLVDGASTYDALLEAIAGAREHIHLEYYILEPDRIGTRLRDALVERARAGVKVRLLVDAVGSGRLKRAFLAPLLDAGAEVAWFHPFRVAVLKPMLNLRTHRKIAVVDGVIGFTGGINITDTEDERVSDTAYRDLHLRFTGRAVHGLQTVFLEDWLYAIGKAPSEAGLVPFDESLHLPRPTRALERGLQRVLRRGHSHEPRVLEAPELVKLRDRLTPGQRALYPFTPPGGIALQWLPSGPDTSWEPIHRALMQAIDDARERVWLVTPYFVPTEPALYALQNAALRGLDVRIVVPRRADSMVVTLAARSYFQDMTAAGARVWEYGPRMLHTKALLVDDSIAVVGSANFDPRSFRLNFELCAVLFGPVAARALAQVIAVDMAQAKEVSPRRKPSFLQRLGESSARLLSPVL